MKTPVFKHTYWLVLQSLNLLQDDKTGATIFSLSIAVPTKELNDEYLSRGGHWYCHSNGYADNYSLAGYALAEALNEQGRE